MSQSESVPHPEKWPLSGHEAVTRTFPEEPGADFTAETRPACLLDVKIDVSLFEGESRKLYRLSHNLNVESSEQETRTFSDSDSAIQTRPGPWPVPTMLEPVIVS